MKFILTVRSRPRPDESVTDTHARFVAGLHDCPPGWGLAKGDFPRVQEPGKEFLSVVKLSGLLGSGIKGSLNYRNRAALRDEAACDDWLNLEFDPSKVDYATLIDKAFQRYIEALNAYVGDVAEYKTLVDGFEKWRRTKKTGRDGVFRIWPVAYYDRELCKRAFNLTPAQAAAHLKGAVERVDASKKGLLIVAARNVLPQKEIASVDKRLRPLLIS